MAQLRRFSPPYAIARTRHITCRRGLAICIERNIVAYSYAAISFTQGHSASAATRDRPDSHSDARLAEVPRSPSQYAIDSRRHRRSREHIPDRHRRLLFESF
jgi:hypothetical protein